MKFGIGSHICLLSVAIMALTPVFADNGTFDTFFTNARIRASLDEARQKSNLDADIPVDDGEVVHRRNVKVNGLIISSTGRSSQIWVNDDSKWSESGPIEAMRLVNTDQGSPKVAMKISGGNEVQLKPGEIYSLDSGVVRDAYDQKQSVPETDLATDLQASEEETDNADESFEFDETKLVEQDERIQLLEERLEQLESSITK